MNASPPAAGRRGRAAGAVLTALAALVLLAGLTAVGLIWRELSGGVDTAIAPQGADPALVAQGEYLARIGNCKGCHTARGGAPYAGGRGIPTPFGTVYTSNLTPDPATGIGGWSSEAFWRAMHEGRSRDGRLLYPVFPYPNTTHVRRADSDAILAYLRSLPAITQANRPQALRFPYSSQAALAAWRVLFFRAAEADAPLPASLAGPAPTEPAARAAWERGAYLVRGLGHCSACHAPRNLFGASGDALTLGGGRMPVQNWYAPSLRSPREAGVAGWDIAQVVALLTTGVAERAGVQGPMAEVVQGSTQYLSAADARAIARFLTALPAATQDTGLTGTTDNDDDRIDIARLRRTGEQLYGDRCAACHGKSGEGRSGAYPALAGNRALLMNDAANLVQTLVHGGFAPVTAGNPRPFGMPPYGLELSDTELAGLITYLRSAWGNQAKALSPLAVQRMRTDGNGR